MTVGPARARPSDPMTELSREELIGAYLDGELSSEERARAEQLLAESAESRQMLEELRALRARLQALPRLSLPTDFSQRVLQRAEREMLLGTSAPTAPRAAVSPRESMARDTVPFGRRWVRPLVYAGFAAAAALLIAVFLPSEARRGGNVATLQHQTEIPPGSVPDAGTLAAGEDDRQPRATAMPKNAPAMHNDERAVPAFAPNSAAAEHKEAEGAAPAPASEPSAAGGAADDLLIVDLQITHEALARGTFERLLRSAEIQVREEPQAARGEAVAKSSTAEEADFRKSLAGEKAKLPVDAELFYVEATAEQIEKALAAIDKESGAFPALLVDPAASEGEQTDWRMRFRRIPASAQVEVAEEELDGALRQHIDRLMSAAPALADEAAADAAGTSTARRIEVAANEADTAKAATTPVVSEPEPETIRSRDNKGKPRVRAVFVLRAVDDPVPPPTQPAEGVE
jgi:hypothetical protein